MQINAVYLSYFSHSILIIHTCMQLKLYAKKEFQTGETGYVDKEKGYIYDIDDYNWTLTVTAIIVTITAICISSKILQKWLDIKSKQAELKMTFFFAFVSVVSLINPFEIGIEVYKFYYKNEFTIEEKYLLSTVLKTKIWYHKIIEIIVGMLIFAIFGIIGQSLIECRCLILPQPPKGLPNCFCIPNCFFCSCMYFFHFGNFFYFTYTIGLNIVPTFMMLFIAPIETISVVIFFGALLASAVMGMAHITLYFKKASGKKRKQNYVKQSFLPFYT